MTQYLNMGSLSIVQPRELSRVKKVKVIFAQLLRSRLAIFDESPLTGEVHDE